MWAALIKYRAWGGLALLLAVAAVAWAGGRHTAGQDHQAETAALKAKYAQEKLDAEQRHTAALQAALAQQQQWQPPEQGQQPGQYPQQPGQYPQQPGQYPQG